MASPHHEDHNQLVARLTTGFGAMLQQVQELANKNAELEQRLARVLEEAQYLARLDKPLSISGSRDLIQEEKGDYPQEWAGYTEPERRHSRSESGEERTFMGTEDQENAMAIADGVEAWKRLTNGEGPLWRQYNAEKSYKRQTRENSPEQDALPTGHPAVSQGSDGNAECPFAALSHLGEQETRKVEPSMMQRPDLLPTPPHTQEHFTHVVHEDANHKHDSPPPSISGSIAKCPIRMLDERSPEEIAQFFENHKHEIPRSHEICVRRYQSNSHTIRELDAKYGNLANMIKGLGAKHQPLLPSKEDSEEDDAGMDTKSMRNVESWANNVDVIQQGADMPNDTKTHLSESDERRGNFDRPLKEIRVGESPSRPWGISVPAAVPKFDLGENASTPTPKGPQPKAGDAHYGHRARIATSHAADGIEDDKPRMLFTGPVFIGYGPEQAAALIKECQLKT